MIFSGHFLSRAFEIIPPCRIRFIHFYFQLVEKFEHVKIFQLVEINFRFAENCQRIDFKKSNSIKWIV